MVKPSHNICKKPYLLQSPFKFLVSFFEICSLSNSSRFQLKTSSERTSPKDVIHGNISICPTKLDIDQRKGKYLVVYLGSGICTAIVFAVMFEGNSARTLIITSA